MTTSPLIPAATVIPMRDRPGGPPELLLLRRSAGMNFAARAWTFPGGRIDPEDGALAPVGNEIDPDDAAARVAAIRETIEEAGLAIGLSPSPPANHIAAIRAALAERQAFATLVGNAGYRLDLDALTPFARWIPFEGAPRRFDTRFYLATTPDADAVETDGAEADAACWITAENALARADSGEMSIIFPTRCNLIRLAPYRSVSEAVAASIALPVRPLTTFIEARNGVRHICVPVGFGYPPLAQPIPAAPGS